MNKNIIVTGGLGFIGSNLIDLLISKKYSVINLDKVSYSSNFYNLKEYKNHTKYKFIKCDLNSKKILSILMKYKPICIFNLAAETHVDRSIDGPKNFINSNVLGTFNLLEAFRVFSSKHNSKMVHISTDEVYGDILKGRSDENYSYKPSSPYAASKAASDHLVYSYIRTYKIPAIISNCSNNYGPKQHPEKLIPKLIYNIIISIFNGNHFFNVCEFLFNGATQSIILLFTRFRHNIDIIPKGFHYIFLIFSFRFDT